MTSIFSRNTTFKIILFILCTSFFLIASNSFAKATMQTLPSYNSNDTSDSLVLQQLRNSDSLLLDYKTIAEEEEEYQNIPRIESVESQETIRNINDIQKIAPSTNEAMRVNSLICDKSYNSPLCDNITQIQTLQYISEQRGVDLWLLVGISHAESRLGTDFASGCTPEYYNWGGVKARRPDTGEVLYDYPIPDMNGCWIYKFDSLEDYWISTSNIIKMGYLDKGCSEEEDVARCISECYVGGCGSGEEENWIRAVNMFRPYPLLSANNQ